MGAARNMSSERGKSCERSSLLLFCLLFFCIAFSSVYHRPIVEEGRIEKWDSLMFLHSPALLLTADVEKWQFGNRIHHLMRSFHPSTINIAEGSIFRPPGEKILEKFLGPILRAPPSSIPVGQAKGRPFLILVAP